jgi:hypothetical protein
LEVWGSPHDASNAFVNERTKGLIDGTVDDFLCHPIMAMAQMGHDVRPWTQPKQYKKSCLLQLDL